MKNIIICLYTLFIGLISFAQNQTYSKVKINLEQISLESIEALGLPMDHGTFKPGFFFIGEFFRTGN